MIRRFNDKKNTSRSVVQKSEIHEMIIRFKIINFIYRLDGEPRKCLPHQSHLCLNSLEDSSLSDISTVCCWSNQVDVSVQKYKQQGVISYNCQSGVGVHVMGVRNVIDNNQGFQYFCCTGVPSKECPDYSNVTVVIHHNFPESPFPLKSFFFKKDIEKDVEFSNRS